MKTATQKQIAVLQGEFDEWRAKYRITVREFRECPTQDTFDRLKVLEKELVKIAEQI